MLYGDVLHAEARAYRFDNGRYFVSEPFWSEGKAFEDELHKLGYFQSRTYHGGTYAVWQKGRTFIFVILVGPIAWTVEVVGLPNYLQFISQNLGPALAHSDRLPDAEIEALRNAEAEEAKQAQAEKVREVKADAPLPRDEVAVMRNDVSCVAAIGVIDDGWRRCVHRKGPNRSMAIQSIALPGEPFRPCPPDYPAIRRAAKV